MSFVHLLVTSQSYRKCSVLQQTVHVEALLLLQVALKCPTLWIKMSQPFSDYCSFKPHTHTHKNSQSFYPKYEGQSIYFKTNQINKPNKSNNNNKKNITANETILIKSWLFFQSKQLQAETSSNRTSCAFGIKI